MGNRTECRARHIAEALGPSRGDMRYEEACDYLDTLVDFEKLGAVYFGRDRFQLATVRTLLARVGNPQDALRIVHLAGTKGKGSTAAMLEAILRAAGICTGLFTQPHLLDIRERSLIDGVVVAPDEFAAAVAQVRPHVEDLNGQPDAEPVTFYEAHLVASLLMFAARSVNVAVVETGLGGRLDATNALEPVACAITRIDYDHTDILGDRLEDIAREKAGILKPGIPCVFAPQESEVAAALCAQAAAVGAPQIPCPLATVGADGSFTIEGRAGYPNLRLALAGRHQVENAAVAIGLAEVLAGLGVEVGPAAVREGLVSVRWPGRFQVIEGQPTIVLDVAHNAVSARVLREGLQELLSRRPEAHLHLVVGMARDKDVRAFVETLSPIASSLTATRAASPRAASPESIADIARPLVERCESASVVRDALTGAQAAAQPGDVVCVTGSFHVVGEAMHALGLRP